jgi:nitrogen regulatory protein P-II 1
MEHSLAGYKLIISVVKRGLATRIINKAKKVGAKGGTTVFGKGTAEKRIYENILGIVYEPEKEVVFIIVEENYVNEVLEAIAKEGNFKKRGNGIGFVVNIKKCIGIVCTLKSL